MRALLRGARRCDGGKNRARLGQWRCLGLRQITRVAIDDQPDRGGHEGAVSFYWQAAPEQRRAVATDDEQRRTLIIAGDERDRPLPSRIDARAAKLIANVPFALHGADLRLGRRCRCEQANRKTRSPEHRA